MTGSKPAGSSSRLGVFRQLTAGPRIWWLRVAVAVLIGGLAFVVTPKPYVARASILLLAPNGANPYLGYNPSLVSTVNILLVKAQDSPGILGSDAKFSVVLDDNINEPLIDATTTDSNPARAQAALVTLEKYLTSSLASIQKSSGVPTRSAIHGQVVTQTPTAQITRYKAIEHAILGAPFVFFLLVWIDVVFRRRPEADLSDTEPAQLPEHDAVTACLR
ncbi:MAG TPA: hypothetical protein VK662_14900 [Acidothermaceae bacterium]|jgi:hypothetical protein|nr:hypothetical protein [Acidothermaceae bacterium]